MDVTKINYEDLIKSHNINSIIEKAYGKDGLGILLIEDVPNLMFLRENLLQSIKEFAELPENIKNKYVHDKSNYSVGWSHGKEKMKKGNADYKKGSFYANPIQDIITTDYNLKEEKPEIYSDNIWPEEVPNVEVFFKQTSKLLVDIGYQVTKLLDEYLVKITDGKHNRRFFYNLLKNSSTYKGRLLHYFPYKPEDVTSIDSSCGWHLDHGCITILLSPLFFNLLGEKEMFIDSGLIIKTNNGEDIAINIPENSIAIQLGETIQYLSGGFLRATPHCVQSCKRINVSREQFALFMDCDPTTDFKLPDYSLKKEKVVECKQLPKGVPLLESRVKDCDTYGDFVKKTISAYYQ